MTTKSFSNSAAYYDLLYKNKNYSLESLKLKQLIKKLSPQAKTILDLGCGTATHAICLSKLGYEIVGVDASPQMIKIAKQKISSSGFVIPVQKGNITKLQHINDFDIIVSLFHVFSYQTTHAAIQGFFTSAYKNLLPGGYLIFDCWYGPGVIHAPPEKRTYKKIMKNFTFIRIKTPHTNVKTHVVAVTHATSVLFSNEKKLTYKEVHKLRYFFLDDIKDYLSRSGFHLISWGDINNNFSEPKRSSWDVTFVAQKTD